jgi:MSHA biogenesis protein MshE
MSTPEPRKKLRLGDLLVESRVISAQQLDSALAEQKKSGRKLGRTLIELGYIAEDQLLDFLAQQLKVPLVDLTQHRFDPDTVKLLPEAQARRYRALVLEAGPDALLVGMADPTDLYGYDELARVLKRPLKLAVVRESDLLHALDQVYRHTDQLTSIAAELGQELAEGEFDIAQLGGGAGESDAPVFRLLQTIFNDAVAARASDIHIEPDDAVLRLRLRVDGVLQEQVMNEKRVAPALLLRLKLMAGLDIAEKRLPQDGRFHIRVKDKGLDVRLSTLPTQYGESAVLRLLDPTGGIRPLAELGMPADLLERFARHIHHPHGLVLVTGPTGSGKTTTLYSALAVLNSPERKIITVEDPVEYRLARVQQVQVHTKIGLTFASVLRTALRQDPDVVLVGEMRDQETAEIGLRAAMTGHLVLSTLHTNDAVSTVHRLMDMGAPGYLIASALRAIIAQRLVRRVCPHCAAPATLDAQAHAFLATLGVAADAPFVAGAGCTHCNQQGYRGRVGVYELLEPDEAMGDALRRNDTEGFTRAARESAGYRPLVAYALDAARTGQTTLAEVMRLAGEGG